MSLSRVSLVTKEHYTLQEIEKSLKNEPLMYAYAESGDIDVVHHIVDARLALDLAQPTDIQIKTLNLVWQEGYSLVETGKMLGVTPQAVKFNLDLLKIKIKKVLDAWKLKDREELLDGTDIAI